jgi:hypothetical protein
MSRGVLYHMFFGTIKAEMIFILFLLGMLVSACATSPPANPYAGTPSIAAVSEAGKWGVQVVSLRLTAADHMIDFRYRVVDPQKATPLLNRRIKPHLIEEETGARMEVPRYSKLGPARQISDNPTTDRVYTMIFGNTGKIVKPGSRVTIVIGEIRLENLTVE